MRGATVPETAIHKNCNFGSGEHNVGPAIPILYRAGMDSVPEASCVQISPDNHFGFGISALVSLHRFADGMTGSPRDLRLAFRCHGFAIIKSFGSLFEGATADPVSKCCQIVIN
jgi:hypothetical protein